MVYNEDIASCLKNYRDEIIPLLDQEEYESAGKYLGEVIVELRRVSDKPENSIGPGSNDSVLGLISRLSLLQYYCLKDCPDTEQITTLKEIVQRESR